MNVFDIEDLGGDAGNKKAGKASKKSSSSSAGECMLHCAVKLVPSVYRVGYLFIICNA
jgi:hypothetical protein